jgi:hypothetical protein
VGQLLLQQQTSLVNCASAATYMLYERMATAAAMAVGMVGSQGVIEWLLSLNHAHQSGIVTASLNTSRS